MTSCCWETHARAVRALLCWGWTSLLIYHSHESPQFGERLGRLYLQDCCSLAGVRGYTMLIKVAGATNYRSCIFIASVTTKDIHNPNCPVPRNRSAKMVLSSLASICKLLSFAQPPHRLSPDVKKATEYHNILSEIVQNVPDARAFFQNQKSGSRLAYKTIAFCCDSLFCSLYNCSPSCIERWTLLKLPCLLYPKILPWVQRLPFTGPTEASAFNCVPQHLICVYNYYVHCFTQQLNSKQKV